ncbi:plasmid pRiA4b ORF-3 family protein [bacterium]|nr:plasmid pRiA4b ORF-3 family protein [bacterium]
MANIIFRFRVTFEDVDDVERIIDVSGKNTFRDFHNAIQQAINFDNLKPASFYKTNDHWRPYEEFCTEPKASAKAAGASELGKFIDDPHQKFLYVYDEDGDNWALRAEVIKLMKEEAGILYPNLVKSVGNAPKQFVDPKAIIDDPSGKFFKEADDLIGELLDDDEDDEDDDEEEEDDDFNLYGDQVDESEL